MNRKILSIALTTSFCLFSHYAAATIEPIFSPSSIVKQSIIDQIEGAEVSIDIAMYSFSDQGILNAVKAAATSGIQIRLILNKANQDRAKAEALEEAGVDVRYVTPVMHNKFAIFDGPLKEIGDAQSATLLTGSGNWSSSSATKYDEDLLIFKDESAFVLAFQKEFNYLWNNAREFGEAWTYEFIELLDENQRNVVFTSENMISYLHGGQPTFKPAVEWDEGVAGKKIIEEISLAESNIRIASAHFRRPDFYTALKGALDRGVKVQILLDQQEFHSFRDNDEPTYYDELLAQEGAEVRYKTYSRYWDYRTAKQMHSKYLLVDDRTVVTGSFNWSRNAETNVMENLVRITGDEIGSSYFENFAAIWNYGAGELDSLIARIHQQSGNGPCFFNPISLSPDEIVELRNAYAQGACRAE